MAKPSVAEATFQYGVVHADIDQFSPTRDEAQARLWAASCRQGCYPARRIISPWVALDDEQADGSPYRLTEQDAAHMNAAVDMPEQPVYDWTGVAEDEQPDGSTDGSRVFLSSEAFLASLDDDDQPDGSSTASGESSP